MAKTKLHYDGWLALPAVVRRRLGITTGDEMTLELVDGGVVLRPTKNSPFMADVPDIEEHEDDLEPELAAETIQQAAPKPAKKPARKPSTAGKSIGAKRTAATKDVTPAKAANGRFAAALPKTRGRRKAASTQ